MILAYIPNHAQRSIANARAVAAKTWPGGSIEFRNPGRMSASEDVQTAGVSGVIVAGPYRRIIQLYRRAGIEVMEIGVDGDRAQHDNHKCMQQLARMTQDHGQLAEAMAALPASKLCAVASAITDLSFLAALRVAERAHDEPRAEVIEHIDGIYEEMVQCETS